MHPESALFILAISASLAAAQTSQQCRSAYRQLSNGSLCIRSDFTRTVGGIASDPQCAVSCDGEPRCQAFTTADGPCQLFVFDKCSKSVRNCSCSRRGRLFVKRQPGLEPGALCPSGYGDELCGVKYRLITATGRWSDQRQRCEAEPGLVIMADVMDAAEMSHVNAMYTAHNPGIALYLGGYRVATGVALTDGWLWVGCNATVGSFVWGSGEPNTFSEKATARHSSIVNLVDITDTQLLGVICECVSPFA